MSANINAQSLANMTPEELRTYINSQVATLATPQEIDDFKQAVTDALDEYRTEVQDQIDQMKDLVRGRGRGRDPLQGDELEEANRLLDELKNELKDIDHAADNAEEDITRQAAHQALVDQDLSAQPNPTITGTNYETSSDVPPPEYTIHVGSGNGASGNPFAPDAAGGTADFDQYLKDQGILDDDGKLISGKTYADIEAARNTWLGTKRMVTLSLPAGSTIELVGVDGSTVTFKVTDKDGKVAYLNIEGDAYLNFSGGIAPDYFATITATWPPPLIGRSLWQGKLFTELMHPVTDEQELGYVSGYDQESTALSSINEYLTDGPLSSGEQAAFQAAWDKLYTALAEGKDIGHVWDEILATADHRLIAALVFAVAKQTPQNFSALFNGQTARLRNVLAGTGDEAGLNSDSKLAILLLETYAGASGAYPAGANLFETLFAHADPANAGQYIAGLWSGDNGEHTDENKTLLENFTALSARLTGTHGNTNATIENETAFHNYIDLNPPTPEPTGDAITNARQITASEYSTMLARLSGSVDETEYDGADGVDATTITQKIAAILTQLRDTPMTVEAMRSFILDALTSITDDSKNDVATNLLNLLDIYAPDTMDQLLTDQTWCDTIWGICSYDDGEYAQANWTNYDGNNHDDNPDLMRLYTVLNQRGKKPDETPYTPSRNDRHHNAYPR